MWFLIIVQAKNCEEMLNTSDSFIRKSFSSGMETLNGNFNQLKATYKGLLVSVQGFDMFDSKLSKSDLKEFIEVRHITKRFVKA